MAFHERVRTGFLGLADKDPDHYLVLDARRDREEISAAVRERVRPLLTRAPRVVHS